MAAACRSSDLKRLLEDVDVVAVAGRGRCAAPLKPGGRLSPGPLPDGSAWVAANAGELVVGVAASRFGASSIFTGRRTHRVGMASRLSCCRCGSRTKWHTRCATPAPSVARRCGRPRWGAGGGGEAAITTDGRSARGRRCASSSSTKALAIAASQAVAPGFEPWEYSATTGGQYRRLRELDAFLRPRFGR